MTWARVTADCCYSERRDVKASPTGNPFGKLLDARPVLDLPGFRYVIENDRVVGAHHLVEVPDDLGKFLEWAKPHGRFCGGSKLGLICNVDGRVVQPTIEVHFNNDYD